MHSWDTRNYFPDVVRADADITARLGSQVLDTVFDNSYYLQHEGAIFERVFGRP